VANLNTIGRSQEWRRLACRSMLTRSCAPHRPPPPPAAHPHFMTLTPPALCLRSCNNASGTSASPVPSRWRLLRLKLLLLAFYRNSLQRLLLRLNRTAALYKIRHSVPSVFTTASVQSNSEKLFCNPHIRSSSINTLAGYTADK
jgi:hypothetical protein